MKTKFSSLKTTAVLTVCGGLAFTLATPGFGITLNPLADTWVQNGSVANNSADVNLRVKNQNNQLNDRVAFFRFDGSGFTGGNVATASFDLTVTAFSSPVTMNFQLFGISNGALNEGFDATTLTFANSGYTDQSVDNNVNDGLFDGGVPLATGTLMNVNPVGTVISFSGAGLLGFLNANNNSEVAFVVTTSTLADSVFVAFGSVDNATAANRPMLIYSVPEPSTMALGLVAGLGMLLLRRRVA